MINYSSKILVSNQSYKPFILIHFKSLNFEPPPPVGASRFAVVAFIFVQAEQITYVVKTPHSVIEL